MQTQVSVLQYIYHNIYIAVDIIAPASQLLNHQKVLNCDGTLGWNATPEQLVKQQGAKAKIHCVVFVMFCSNFVITLCVISSMLGYTHVQRGVF
jgi:hypothetical protein